MSASFRNAELMRIGKGYFWKSLGKSTTASHCSPNFPDRNPGIEDIPLVTKEPGHLISSVTLSKADSRRKQRTQHQTRNDEPYANMLARKLTHLCPAPWERNLRRVLVRHSRPLTGKNVLLKATSLLNCLLENHDSTRKLLAFHCTVNQYNTL